MLDNGQYIGYNSQAGFEERWPSLVYGTGLENRRFERNRGFESLSLRQNTNHYRIDIME